MSRFTRLLVATVAALFTGALAAPAHATAAAAVKVVADGPTLAHHGDTMLFSFAVSNAGDSPLHDVLVVDDLCAVEVLPAEKLNDDGDAKLEDAEVWVFRCAMPVPVGAHAPGEQDPVRGVATATAAPDWATDDTPRVSATDDHLTDILHPAIALKNRADRARASVGDRIGYRFDVTNPGDAGLAVSFADPRCDWRTVTGPQKVTGDTDSALEPGELWRYRCTHKVTGADPDPFWNTAKVTGVDAIGGPGGTVSRQDSACVDLVRHTKALSTEPPPESHVLGATQRPVSGRARLHGASRCARRPFRAVVSGRQIRRVTFSVDGRRVAQRSARPNQLRFTARIRPGRLDLGAHRVTARVVFRTISGTRPRTLAMSFQRCSS